MQSKPKSNSKLDRLPPEARDELRARLLRNAGYAKILEWLREEHGVSSSLSSLSSWYHREVAPVVKERRRFAAMRAEALGRQMEQDPVNWDVAIIDRTKQLAFEFLDSEDADADTIKKLLDAISRARGQELDERKVALMEEKAAEAKAKLQAMTEKARSRGGLTEETLKEIEEATNLL